MSWSRHKTDEKLQSEHGCKRRIFTFHAPFLNHLQKRFLTVAGVFIILFVLSACTPNEQPEIAIIATTPTPFVFIESDTTSKPDQPSITPTAITSSQIEKVVFESKNYPKPITARLYLPPGYTASPDKPYPVLILLHGSNANSEQWVRIGAPATADQLITQNEISPLVIIMPEEPNSMVFYSETTFGDVLVNEILPKLQTTYPLCTIRECIAVGGLSRGAVWAARLAFLHWDIFGAAGLHSMPATIAALPEWVHQIPKDELPRVYMDIGDADKDWRNAKKFEETLTFLEIPHEWIFQKGNHTETYWSAHVEEYLRWYSEGWKK
jgi:enterochelin esterase-like enzyme